MKELIALVLIVTSSFSLQAQLLLSPGQSFTYSFLEPDLQNFGSGYPPGNPFATFYTDLARSTPGASYTVDLFENDLGQSPVTSVTGTGNVTAIAPGGWQDLQGVARVTVNSGDVFFDTVLINVYRSIGGGDYELYSATTPVPEPGVITLGALGLVGLLGWIFARRRR
jgi:hypothetical protein